MRILGIGKEASSPSEASSLEGLVPVSILKPFPPQRRDVESASGTDGDATLTNQSPANKRRGFSG